MTRGFVRSAGTMAVLAGFLTGCTPDMGPSPVVSSGRADGLLLTTDALFLRVSERAPGFAGLMVSRGRLVVKLVDLQDSASVRSAVETDGLLQSAQGLEVAAGRGVLYESVEFSFAELSEIRRTLAAHGVLREAAFSDLDEALNRVRIGARNEAAAVRLRTRVASVPVNQEAVLIQVRRGAPAADLADHERPVPGGFRIDGGAVGGCSLGVNPIPEFYDHGFVTASHCTGEAFDSDYDNLYQPDTRSSGNVVGRELVDPPLQAPGGTSCDSLVTSVGCRFSDAAFVGYNDSADGYFGAIARTQGIGSTTINSTYPRFLISDAMYSTHYVGLEVNRVGYATGWQAGEVTATCVDYNDWVGGVALLCQSETDAIADNGDSGGPVFAWDTYGSFVELVGILVGNIDSVTMEGDTIILGSIVSTWMHVEFEVGGEAGFLSVVY